LLLIVMVGGSMDEGNTMEPGTALSAE